MDIKKKIWEILAVYSDYTNNTDYPDWNKTTLIYDDEEFDIFERDVEKVKEIIKELEILEAIKNKAQNNRFFRGCLLRMFCETKKTPNGMKKEKIKEENYDKITRWLDEKSD